MRRLEIRMQSPEKLFWDVAEDFFAFLQTFVSKHAMNECYFHQKLVFFNSEKWRDFDFTLINLASVVLYSVQEEEGGKIHLGQQTITLSSDPLAPLSP